MNIKFENEEYFSICSDFDLAEGIISLKTTEFGRGSFFTVIPISNYLYRKSSPTKAEVNYRKSKHYHEFVLIDDWGRPHYIEIPNKSVRKYWLEKQIIKLIAYNLMEENVGRKIIGE